MDYCYLCQNLMRDFKQLVIFDLKEVSYDEVSGIINTTLVYDLSYQLNCDKKYYYGSYNYKPLIIILPISHIASQYTDYLTTIYNLYGAIVRRNKQFIPYEEMERLTTQLTTNDKQIHWIWFRDKDFRLPDKIMIRAKSWIELNPEFTINLWTNLVDQIELEDFISSMSDEYREYFINGRITVKYNRDLLNTISTFCDRFHSELNNDVKRTLLYLYTPQKSTTTTNIITDVTLTHTTIITTIKTDIPNNYKIDKIFQVDMYRVIILMLYGGIYCDFNDTICFFPMKYLLTLYNNDFFVGTDDDIEHPAHRNNYFIYSSVNNNQFNKLGIMCVNRTVVEYTRITSPEYIKQYLMVCIQLVGCLNVTKFDNSMMLLPILSESTQIKSIMNSDKYKDKFKIIRLVNEILYYCGGSFRIISHRITQELEYIDIQCLKNGMIKMKRFHKNLKLDMLDVNGNTYGDMIEFLEKKITTHEFYDFFLTKYAEIMTHGDLITYTNIAYIDEIKNLIPFLRMNRLSTISMITHIYDRNNYNYNHSPDVTDLRKLFL